MDRLSNFQQQNIIKPLQQQPHQLMTQKQLEDHAFRAQISQQQSLHKKPTIDPQMYTYKPEKNYKKHHQRLHLYNPQQPSNSFETNASPSYNDLDFEIPRSYLTQTGFQDSLLTSKTDGHTNGPSHFKNTWINDDRKRMDRWIDGRNGWVDEYRENLENNHHYSNIDEANSHSTTTTTLTPRQNFPGDHPIHQAPEPPRFPTNLRKKSSHNCPNVDAYKNDGNHGYYSYTVDRRPKLRAFSNISPWLNTKYSNENLNQNNVINVESKNNKKESLSSFYKKQNSSRKARLNKNEENEIEEDEDDNDLHLKLFIPQKPNENAPFDTRFPPGSHELHESHYANHAINSIVNKNERQPVEPHNPPSPFKTPLPLTLCPWLRLPNGHRASLWKYLSLSLILLSLLLLFMLVYFIISFVLSRHSNLSDASISNNHLSSPSSFTNIILDRVHTIALRRGEGWKGKRNITISNADVTMTFYVPFGAILGVYGSTEQPPTHAKFQFFHQIDARRDRKVSKRELLTGSQSFSPSSISPLPIKSVETYTIRQSVDRGTLYLFLYNDLTSTNLFLNLTLSLNESCLSGCLMGVCRNRICVCDKGFHGERCDNKKCDERCQGDCREGNCVCPAGKYGDFCSIEGCQNGCSGHGKCTMSTDDTTSSSLPLQYHFDSHSLSKHFLSSNRFSYFPPTQSLPSTSWRCMCDVGWSGEACSNVLETVCSDRIDNDGDSLYDCKDPDCCSDVVCSSTIYCKTSTNPIHILLRKQSTSVTSSFYQKVKFLTEEGSVQNNVKPSFFIPLQVSVIRGRVVDTDGMPLTGVKVESPEQPHNGNTYTREEGFFDLLVNGGGSLTLKFTRSEFKTVFKAIFIPWNKMIVMETVVLAIESTQKNKKKKKSCGIVHDVYNLQPAIHSTWTHERGSGYQYALTNKMILQESLQVPGTSIYLKYSSSKTEGFASILFIRLTTSTIPPKLAYIKVLIDVEGTSHENLLEAREDLVYKFTWRKKNAYDQKVYGVVLATVSVGYVYNKCEEVFWEKRSAYIHGYDVVTSELGAFNFHFRHTLNFMQGILQKGDGSNEYLKDRPGTLVTWVGNGASRSINCDVPQKRTRRNVRLSNKRRRKKNKKNERKLKDSDYINDYGDKVQLNGCEGNLKEAKTIAPVALASGDDGSVFVGDYNYIRKISPSWTQITNLLKLKIQATVDKYFMTTSPLDGKLYISLPHPRIIIRTIKMDANDDLTNNYEMVAGSGEPCYHDVGCGDGGPALQAKLFFPKGIAINKDGVLFIADGNMIRKVESNIITTIIGYNHHPQHFNPFPCFSAVPQDNVMLHWPKALAINPLDQGLHILSDNLIYKLTHGQVILVAGKLPHCYEPRSPSFPSSSPFSKSFKTVEDISFSPEGELFIVENDGVEKNFIYKLKLDGSLESYLGSKDDEEEDDDDDVDNKNTSFRTFYDNDNEEVEYSNDLTNKNISALTVSQNGSLILSDVMSKKIYVVLPTTPAPDRMGNYYIADTFNHHCFIFNRFGHHTSTINFLTNQHIYNLTYTVNSFYGTLKGIVDNQGNFIRLKKQIKQNLQELSLSNGLELKVQKDHSGLLQHFTHQPNQSFIKSIIDHNPHQSTHYDYLERGLIGAKRGVENNIITVDTSFSFDPTGRLNSIANQKQEAIMIDQLNLNTYLIRTNDRMIRTRIGEDSMEVLIGDFQVKVINSPSYQKILVPALNYQTSISSNHIILDCNRFFKSFKDVKKSTNEQKLVIKKQIGLSLGDEKLKYELKWIFYDDPKTNENSLYKYKGRKLMVNGKKILAIEFNKDTNTDNFFIFKSNPANIKGQKNENIDKVIELLNIDYMENGLIKKIYSKRESEDNLTSFQPAEIHYDNQHRIQNLRLKGATKELSQEYEFSYNDHSNALQSVKKNSFPLIEYEYIDGNQMPVKVTFGAYNITYHYQYSSKGLLTSISDNPLTENPNKTNNDEKQKHTFSLKCLTSLCRLLYKSPRFQTRNSFKVDYDLTGQVTRVQYPSGLIGWEAVSSPQEGLFMLVPLTNSPVSTQATVRFHINKETSKLKEGKLVVENVGNDDKEAGGDFVQFFSSSLKFDSRYVLARWHISQRSLHLSNNDTLNENNSYFKNKALSNAHITMVAKYNYSYNKNLKVALIQSHIDTTPHFVGTHQFEYDVFTGLLTRSNDFHFRWKNQSKIRIISRNNFRFVTEWDAYGTIRTQRIVVITKNNKEDNQDEYSHNGNYENTDKNDSKLLYKSKIIKNQSKPLQWKIYIQNMHPREYNYIYDQSGNCLLLVKDSSDQVLWRYKFDRKLNVMNEVFKNGDSFRKIDKVKWSKDGFLKEFVKKGKKFSLSYDSMGMLGSVVKTSMKYRNDKPICRVKFFYDSFKRLTTILYYTNSITSTRSIHFFYNHPQKLDLLTHTFDSKTDQHTTYYYDDDNMLMGAFVGTKMFYIDTDFFGSPVLLVDEDNYNNMKNILYSPTGDIIDEETGDQLIPIGFHGGLRDHDTGFLYFVDKGWFNPHDNHFIAYDPSQYFISQSTENESPHHVMNSRFIELMSNMAFLNPYLPDFGFWKETSLGTNINYGVEKIFALLKYDLDFMMPKLSHFGIPIAQPTPPSFHLIENYYSSLLTSFKCSYDNDFVKQVYKLSSTSISAFTPFRDNQDSCQPAAAPSSWMLNHINNIDLLPQDVTYNVNADGMMVFKLAHHHQHQEQSARETHSTSLAHLFANIFNNSFLQNIQLQKNYSHFFPEIPMKQSESDNFVISFVKKSTREEMNDETRVFTLNQSILLTFDLFKVAKNNLDIIFKSNEVLFLLTYVFDDS